MRAEVERSEGEARAADIAICRFVPLPPRPFSVRGFCASLYPVYFAGETRMNPWNFHNYSQMTGNPPSLSSPESLQEEAAQEVMISSGC